MGQKVPVRGTDVKKQIFRATDQKEFIGLLDGLCMCRHAWQAWGDFVEASAIAVSNSCDKTGLKRNEREERYRQIMAGYEPADCRKCFLYDQEKKDCSMWSIKDAVPICECMSRKRYDYLSGEE